MLRPTAIFVKPFENFKLLIYFDNGEKRLLDISNYFSIKPFQKLKNKAIFDTVKTNGITIEWIDGLDICPDDLYYNSLLIEHQNKLEELETTE